MERKGSEEEGRKEGRKARGLKERARTNRVSDLVQLGSDDRVGRDSLEELSESLDRIENEREAEREEVASGREKEE